MVLPHQTRAAVTALARQGLRKQLLCFESGFPRNVKLAMLFVKGGSCLTNLIPFFDKVTRSADEGRAVDVF